MADELTTLLTATGGAFLGKFVGPAAEQLGKVAWERIQQLSQRATAILADVGREPQPVEPKILLPLVQAASYETDPELAEKWATLLANAAMGRIDSQVQPSFIEVLRQLTPTQVFILDKIYQEVDASIELGESWQPGIDVDKIKTELSLSFLDFQRSIGNLLRLSLCNEYEAKHGAFLGKGAPGTHMVDPTIFGYTFVKSCTPPKPL